mmetsp:Transcript_10229/g.33520  ORF Transcript_10229/g.33520 Transcript_10229/m.33520 type:complete len:204 (+) Transcript_10229:519-1130(+)
MARMSCSTPSLTSWRRRVAHLCDPPSNRKENRSPSHWRMHCGPLARSWTSLTLPPRCPRRSVVSLASTPSPRARFQTRASCSRSPSRSLELSLHKPRAMRSSSPLGFCPPRSRASPRCGSSSLPPQRAARQRRKQWERTPPAHNSTRSALSRASSRRRVPSSSQRRWGTASSSIPSTPTSRRRSGTATFTRHWMSTSTSPHLW